MNNQETEEYPKSGIQLKENEIKVPAPTLRVAMLFMAKKDTRVHFNGVNLTMNSEINATNGHVLFKEECEFELDQDIIIRPYNKIPAKCVDAIINTEGRTIALYDKNFDLVSEIMFEYIYATYPLLDSVIPPDDLEIKNEPIGFNAGYLAQLGKAFPRGCVMRMSGNERSVLFNSKDHPERTVVMMPLRMPETEKDN